MFSVWYSNEKREGLRTTKSSYGLWSQTSAPRNLSGENFDLQYIKAYLEKKILKNIAEARLPG